MVSKSMISTEGLTVATVTLSYVHSYKDRHGKQRHYYRREGKRITLRGRPGEAEFMRAYEDAAARFVGPQPATSKAVAAGTFDALCISYYRSPEFTELRETSKRTYRGIIDRWRQEHGAKRVKHIERRHIKEHIATAAEVSGPHAANNLRMILQILSRFAVDNEWRRDDPTIGVRPLRAKSTGFVSWSDEDIAAFEKRWAKGTRQRLAMALLLYTGQRRGDVVRMGWQAVSGDSVRVVQSKTGVALTIPLHSQLGDVLKDTPRKNLTFLMTNLGEPFTAAGFGNWFRDACDAAGLKGRSAHGLRKAAARRLAEAGCSALQIGAITGHKTLKELSRYTAAADQVKLARDAINRVS
jgi:integrase